MRFFNNTPSELVVVTDFLKVLARRTIKFDDETRERVAPIILASVRQLLNLRELKMSDIQNTYSMFQIISGTAGMSMYTIFTQFNTTNSEPEMDEIVSLISDGIPIEIPIVLIGPLRHMMVNYLLRDIEDDVELDKVRREWFLGSDYEILIDLFIDLISEINSICITTSPKQYESTVATLIDFTQIYLHSLDYHASP